MQQDIQAKNVEKSQRLTADQDSTNREERRHDAVQEKTAPSVPKRNYRQARREEYAPW